ncbi:MAG: O-antigen ligase family protein [Sphingomonas sp.]|uniref:O-antigen ligase family protein n=1 Tax=Sphingomonas sp. TaxID=28214 RepID=UPI001AC26571|nr:O-antigen ligase family protein [Sphingomonas sp.]MBN8816719.1 O-antigen ligase family protein [Sphingomonas sp.]
MALPRIDIGLAREERLPAILLVIFFITLCIAGGASREDVLAQSVVRGVAVVLMCIRIVTRGLPDLKVYRALSYLLAAMGILTALQLVPLPPSIWTALPGRGTIASLPLPPTMWRPINLVPDAGWNSLFSLLVPFCVLVLVSALGQNTVRRTYLIVLGAIVFSAVLALLQAAGTAPDNPLINGSTTDYAGVFANRNHQALFLSIGIALTWHWGFENGGHLRDRRLWLAFCLIFLMGISILATGSRAGILLGGLALVLGPAVALLNRRSSGGLGLRRAVIWSGGMIVFVAIIGLTSLYFGRAESFTRATTMTVDSDFRIRALPVVWDIAKGYFPFGAGMGSFDAVFRAAEPLALLEPTYFNHAHNDLLETVIETGMFGPVIAGCAAIWLGLGSIRAFADRSQAARLARFGSLTVILVVIASISDYPARTPMIMALIMISGCWLSMASVPQTARNALRATPDPL